jgi:hypothetical protein
MIRLKLGRTVQLLTPPIIWNAYLKARSLRQPRTEQQFDNMRTNADITPLFDGRFGAIHDRYYRLNPFYGPNAYRYRHYNACWFALLCRNVAGDFVCAGVSFGASAKVLYEFVNFPDLNKTLHLVDPFKGNINPIENARRAVNYNSDPDYVLRQFPADAPIKLHRQAVPITLPGPLAFVYSDIGEDTDSDVAALPSFYDALSPGGVWISNLYGHDTARYRETLERLRVVPLWLPSGQGVIIK